MSTSNAGQAFTQQFMDDTVAALKAIGQQLEKMGKQADDADDKVKGLAATIKIAEKGLQAFSSAVAKLDLRGMVKNVLDTSVSFERMQKSLSPVIWSTALASDEFTRLKKFAADSSFTVDDVTKSFVKLKSSGLDAGANSLKIYGDTAAAMGTTLEKYVGAVADAAKSNFDGLKDFGIKATQQGDKVTLSYNGISTTVANNSKAVVAALQNIGQTNFAGGIGQQTQTLDGALKRLGTNVAIFLDKIGGAGLADAVSNLANWFSDTAGSSDVLAESLGYLLTQATELAHEGLQVIAEHLPVVLGGLTALFGAQVLTGFANLVSGIRLATGVMGTFNAIAAANPIGLVIGAIGLVAGAYLTYRMEVGEAEKSEKALKEAQDLVANTYDPLTGTLKGVTQAKKDLAAATMRAALAEREQAYAAKYNDSIQAQREMESLEGKAGKQWAAGFRAQVEAQKNNPKPTISNIPTARMGEGVDTVHGAQARYATLAIRNVAAGLGMDKEMAEISNLRGHIAMLEGAKPGITPPAENKAGNKPKSGPQTAKPSADDQALKDAQAILKKAQDDLDAASLNNLTDAEKAVEPFLRTLLALETSLNALPAGSKEFQANLELQTRYIDAKDKAYAKAQTAVNKEGDTVLRQGSDLDEQTHAMKEGRKALEEYTKKKKQDAELDKFRLELQAAWDKGYRQEGKTLEDIIEDFKKKRQAFEETTAAYENSQKVLSTFEGIFQNGMNSVGDTLVNSLMKGENALQGLKNVALSVFDSIVKAAMQMAIINPLLNAMGLNGGTLLPTLFAANGAAFDGGTPVTAFASGGVVGGPTYFPMKGGVGLMGEAGPEAIMPLRRLANGRLGVETTRHGGAGGGGGMVVNMPITVQGSSGNRTDDEAYARMVGKSVRDAVDARFYDLVTKESRYGGTFNRAF